MTKITHRFQLALIYGIVFLLIPAGSFAQDTLLNKYGLWVIDKTDDLQKTILHDPAKAMLDLKKEIPLMQFDLKYASENNFMHTPLYPSVTTTYLRKPAVDALIKVQKALNKKGLGLKIFDAYRPYSVTEKMWEPVKDDRYAADPKKGSGHNRGVAVDLTLINLKNNQELDMGTGFDNFSDTAHIGFRNLPATILQNRLILQSAMEKQGFKALDTEWWHYYLPNFAEFELLDIDFKQLEKLNTK